MYDLIIVGAGPAGMSAAIYAARSKLKTLIISETIGGYAAEAHKVENYPGYKSISGYDLMDKFKQQVKELGTEIKDEKVTEIIKQDSFSVKTDSSEYQSSALIIAAGTEKRKLGVKGEEEFMGKGVSYCAVCDGAFFKDKVVGIVGGSNSAANAALMLAETSSKVYIIYRKEKLRAEPTTIELVDKNPKIEVITGANVVEIKGDKLVNAVVLDNGNELELSGLFVEIGTIPSVSLAKSLGVKVDEGNYITVDSAQKTNIDRIYAAGDITTGSNKIEQIVTAVSEGTIAALSVFNMLKTS